MKTIVFTGNRNGVQVLAVSTRSDGKEDAAVLETWDADKASEKLEELVVAVRAADGSREAHEAKQIERLEARKEEFLRHAAEIDAQLAE